LAIHEKLAQDFPTVPQNRSLLANTHAGFGQLLGESLGQQKEAEAEHRLALALRQKLADDFPTIPRYRLDLALSLARVGDPSKAVAEANSLVESKSVTAHNLYYAACVCALASASVKGDAKLEDNYAVRGVEVLAKAREAGYFNSPGVVEEMKKDHRFDSLRSRDDFKKLLADLEAREAGEGK